MPITEVRAEAAPAVYGIWSDTVRPSNPSDRDTAAVTLGTRFTVARAGTITTLRFYKSATNTGPHSAALWTANGTRLAQVDFAPGSDTGWQAAVLSTPVPVVAGQTYVVSYRAPHGRYAGDNGVFVDGRGVRTADLTAVAGVYSYPDGFPSQSWQGSSYYVDVLFRPSGAPSPEPANPPKQSGGSAKNCVEKPGACGYPDASTTGVPKGTVLTKRNGSVFANRPGQVISGLDIRGEIVVTAPDVVIKNVRVTGGRGAGSADWVIIVRPGAERLVIRDSEVTTPVGSAQDLACVFNISDAEPTVLRSNLHGCTIGVSSGGGLVKDSYIHSPSQIPGLSHINGVASMGGGGLTVQHNTILNPFEQTSAVALYQDFGTQRNDLVVDNLVAGGGYCFYGGGGRFGATSGIRIINNRLSAKYHRDCGSYGPLAWFEAGGSGNSFSGNVWDSTLAPVK